MLHKKWHVAKRGAGMDRQVRLPVQTIQSSHNQSPWSGFLIEWRIDKKKRTSQDVPVSTPSCNGGEPHTVAATVFTSILLAWHEEVATHRSRDVKRVIRILGVYYIILHHPTLSVVC